MEQTIARCNNMDEPHNVKGKKADKNENILYDFRF